VKDRFQALMGEIATAVAGRPVDESLKAFLDERFPADGPVFAEIERLIPQAVEAGWMCEREHGGIRYGRVVEASDALAGFSVDVVRMEDVVGPKHRHPNGEIDMIMPITPGAKFDGHGHGWWVYGPDSAHHPTLTEGTAFVLYLLPGGAIEFIREPKK